MRDSITQRLEQLKGQQQYLMQESLKVAGAIAVLEELLAATGGADQVPLADDTAPEAVPQADGQAPAPVAP